MHFLTTGNTQQLVLSQTDKPSLEQDEVLIKVKAIGVNRADLLQKAGKYPAPKGDSPILGLEASGEVCEVGADSLSALLGTRVMALTPGGAYAEYVKVKASHIMRMPHAFNWQQGAAIMEVYLTAFQSLFLIANTTSHSTVLVHAGASGVGSAAILLAKSVGARVIATVGSDDKARFCNELGAEHVFNYQSQDWEQACKAANLHADIIIDPIAGDYVNKNLRVAAMDATVVSLAMLGGRYAQLDMAKMLQKRVTVQASTLRNRSDEYKTHLVNQFIQQCSFKLATGVLKPVIDRVFDWSEAEQAHTYLASNQSKGKVILSL